jgi:hypothetical protein
MMANKVVRHVRYVTRRCFRWLNRRNEMTSVRGPRILAPCSHDVQEIAHGTVVEGEAPSWVFHCLRLAVTDCC